MAGALSRLPGGYLWITPISTLMMKPSTGISTVRGSGKRSYGASYRLPESDGGGGMVEKFRALEAHAVCRSSRLMQDLQRSMTERYLAIGKRIITSARIRKRR